MIEDLWYKNAVIYNLDVGTFMDANGDGYGDFEGLMQRLDYLAGLGITCLWLLPFQPTPDRDNGYDISEYYGVDPRHGSVGDFVEFMHQARGRGIRVIMDLVVNHTSDQHPWFKAARSDIHSPYRDWYIWSKKRPKNFQEGMVFPGVQKTTWSYDKEAREYYRGRIAPRGAARAQVPRSAARRVPVSGCAANSRQPRAAASAESEGPFWPISRRERVCVSWGGGIITISPLLLRETALIFSGGRTQASELPLPSFL